MPGQWVCGYGADSVQGPADDTLMVARICRRLPEGPGAGGPTQQPDHSGKTLAHGVSVPGTEDAEVIGILFNYGCHPTSLGPGNMHISPDYIGAARELVEEQFGGHAIFLQGASGDTGPMISYAADPAAADRNGRILGYAACSAIAGMLPPGTGMSFDGAIVSGATLAGWRETAQVPLQLLRSEVMTIQLPLAPQMSLAGLQEEFESAEQLASDALVEGGEASVAYRDARAISERWRRSISKQQTKALFVTGPVGGDDGGDGHFAAHVTLMQLGAIFLVALPGEPYQVLQQMIRDKVAAEGGVKDAVFVAELCNHSSLDLGYILPSDKVGCGTYQDELMSVKAGSLEMVADRVSAMILLWHREAGGAVVAVQEEPVEVEVARL